MEIEIFHNNFILLPQKAIYWKQEQTLLISDIHLGKITHFRKEGIAVPSLALENNFTRLDSLLSCCETKRIIFLGDLFHHQYNKEWERFAQWRSANSEIEMIIIPGNHDILPEQLFADNAISMQKELIIGKFLFSHHPKELVPSGFHVFCGHVHPVFRIFSKGKQSIKLQCFIVDTHQTILPSFGVFTGGYSMQMETGRLIYGIAEDKIFKISKSDLQFSGSSDNR